MCRYCNSSLRRRKSLEEGKKITCFGAAATISSSPGRHKLLKTPHLNVESEVRQDSIAYLQVLSIANDETRLRRRFRNLSKVCLVGGSLHPELP